MNFSLFDLFLFHFYTMHSRVFKKSSSNGKITVYLGKRDFVDHITHVDPIGKLKKIHFFFIKKKRKQMLKKVIKHRLRNYKADLIFHCYFTEALLNHIIFSC